MYRLLFLILLVPFISFGQLKMKKLSRGVTNSLDNERFPYVSANGKAMVYVMYDKLHNKWNLHYSQFEGGDWTRGEEILPVNKNTNILYTGGYCLSPDGNTLYFTTKKYNGVGGYDIFVTHRRGKTWTPPMSIGKPLNSEMDDTNPSISSDGEFIYFSRCKKMVEGQSECCQLMVAERLLGENFKDPVALPSPINKGCESTPRILPDDKTLIFSSNRAGGKGGLDYYFTQRDAKGKWSEPKNMDFINTPEDDRFLSVDLFTHFFYNDLKDEDSHDLYKVMFPDGFNPYTVIAVQGKVVDGNGVPVEARVQIFDAETEERVHFVPTNKEGEYWFLLTEGQIYDFSIIALKGGRTFESEIMDLKVLDKYRTEVRDGQLTALIKNTVMPLKALSFDDEGNYTTLSNKELDRVRRILREDPAIKLELLLFDKGIRQDSIKAPDLTEVIVDTVLVNQTVFEKAKIKKMQDSVEVLMDTLISKQVEVEKLNYTYHNDLRSKQIQSLKTYFVENGLLSRISYKKIEASDPKYAAIIKKSGMDKGVLMTVK